MARPDPTIVLVWESPDGTRFAQVRSSGVRWVEEYPDATLYTKWKTANGARQFARRFHPDVTIELVENYSLTDERRM